MPDIEMITVEGVEMPKTVFDTIYGSGKKDGEIETHKSHKDSLFNKFKDLSGADDSIKGKKFDDMVETFQGILQEQRTALTSKNDKKIDPDTFEQRINDAKIEWEAEYNGKLATEKSNFESELLKKSAVNIAITKNLDMNYEDEFLTNFNKFSYSSDPEDKYKFRENNQPVLTDKAEPAKIEDIVSMIADKKPLFFLTSKGGAGSNKGSNVEGKQDFDRDNIRSTNSRKNMEDEGWFKDIE